MVRLNRTQQKEQTRERLLESAMKAFLRDGYVRASLDGIADDAGYSKGAVYSNFESKEALFCELLRRKLQADIAVMRALMVDDKSVTELLTGMRAYFEARPEVLDFTFISAEFATQVGRGSAYEREYAALYRTQRQAIASLLEQLFARIGRKPPVPTKTIAASVVSLTLGFSIQRGTDPKTITVRSWARAIHSYLAAMAW